MKENPSIHQHRCVDRSGLPPYLLIDQKKYTDFNSFDFFSLSGDPRLKRASLEAVQNSTFTCGNSRGSYGTEIDTIKLEIEIASWFQTKKSLLFSSRNQAVFSLITNTVTEIDLIIYDSDTTAPIVDAAFQVGAHAVSLDLLEEQVVDLKKIESIISLHKKTNIKGKVYFYFEELSSIHGKLSERELIINQLKKINVIPICDVTYSLGIYNAARLGQKLEANDNHYYIGAFGFSLPGIGGFIAGNEAIEKIKTISSAIHTEPSLPVSVAKINLASVFLLPELSVKTSLLKEKSLLLRNRLSVNPKISLLNTDFSPSPVISFQLSSLKIARSIQDHFLANHILCSVVSRGKLRSEASIVRLIISLAHKEDDIESLLRAVSSIRIS